MAGAWGVLFGRRRCYFSDADAPKIGALLEVLPAELAALCEVELVLQRERVVVVDQFQRLTGLQRFEGAKDQRMPLRAGNRADVNRALGAHRNHSSLLHWAASDRVTFRPRLSYGRFRDGRAPPTGANRSPRRSAICLPSPASCSPLSTWAARGKISWSST